MIDGFCRAAKKNIIRRQMGESLLHTHSCAPNIMQIKFENEQAQQAVDFSRLRRTFS